MSAKKTHKSIHRLRREAKAAKGGKVVAEFSNVAETKTVSSGSELNADITGGTGEIEYELTFPSKLPPVIMAEPEPITAKPVKSTPPKKKKSAKKKAASKSKKG